MSDDRDDHESEHATERTTAPQSPYTSRAVAVGVLVTFGIPLLLA